MKRTIIVFSAVLGLLACNDSSTSTTTQTTDSTDHSAHQNTGNNTNIDTAAYAGQSMMSLMQTNMDQMKAVQTTGNPDNDFAALMKIHHMGAVEMAQMELAKGTDPQMKQMAQKMLDDQQKEIAELNTFLAGHNAHGGGEAFYKEVMSKMNNMKMDMDHTGSVDKQFAQMMIPHHQGAIDMAKAYIKSGAHEEQLKTMANKVISEQQKEIQQLQAWLNQNK